MIPERIALVGTGNVASHLAEALGSRIGMIVSRDSVKAEALAKECGVAASGDYESLKAYSPDMIIVSVADHAVTDVVAALAGTVGRPLVVHTSGTVPKEVLSPVSDRTGVLYPLQTFSKGVYVDMRSVPFFTESAIPEDIAIIDALAASISDTVHHADASQRQVLHVAGVFSSNFVNILLEMVGDVLATADYPLTTVRPLVEATVAKAFTAGPHAAQTGPAKRGDSEVMVKHASMLPEDKRRVYELLSEYILMSHKVTLQ